jgi:hypothetical protein
VTPEEREALADEERIIRAALARSMADLKVAVGLVEGWIAAPVNLKHPLPANALMSAAAVHLDAMALFRVRLWRDRFDR